MNKSGVSGGVLDEPLSESNLSTGVANGHSDQSVNGHQHPSAADEAKGIEWDTYGPLLDIQAGLTPDYWENVDVLIDAAKNTFPQQASLRICDIGAGTGNFTSAIAEEFPNAQVVHLEPNMHMNRIARGKFEDAGLNNVEIVESSYYEYAWDEAQWDIVICVNALYMLAPQQDTLNTIRRSLKPGGFFYVVDFGREQDASQWFWYFLKNALKGINTRKYLQSIPKWPQMVAQAREGGKTQVAGQWWTHETDEFGNALSSAGFTVEGLTACYCGFADRAICRPHSD